MKFAVRMGTDAWRVPSRRHSHPGTKCAPAFSIVELLVATVILAVILGIIFSITQMFSQTWGKSTAKIEAFQGARTAFETVTRLMSQATLNTYYDYFDSDGKTRASYGTNTSLFAPVRYGRTADLHFISGKALVPGQVGHAAFFQAPVGYSDDTNYTGMDALLNGCGFYVAYDKDNTLPAFVNSVPNKPADRFRYRVMQYLQPSQELKVYDAPSQGAEKAWFQAPLQADPKPVSILAENVVALIILPKLSKADEADAAAKGKTSLLSPDYEYDTRKTTTAGTTDCQLPPVVEIIMVAIDENSAQRFCTGPGAPDLGVAGGMGSLFTGSGNLETDLKSLTDSLNSNRIAYRVFRTEVALRGAKWSSSP